MPEDGDVRPSGVLSLLCLLSLWLLSCGEKADEPVEPARPVQVATVEVETLDEIVSGVGSVEAVDAVPIKAQAAGRIEGLHFQEGESVRPGALLFSIDDDELVDRRQALRSSLEGARAIEHEATRTFERVRSLHEQGVLPEQDLDEARARAVQARMEVARLEAELSALEEQLGHTDVRAPFEGRLTERSVDPGDYVDIGEPLVTLVRPSALEVQFWVPQRHASLMELGLPVRIHLVSGAERISGEVVFVSPMVEAGSRKILVKAAVEEAATEALKPGLSAAVDVVVARKSGPVVPERALVGTRKGYIVYVVRDSTARARPVEVRLREAGRALVSGVEAGSRVVEYGHDRISDGDPVEIVEERRRAVALRMPPRSGDRGIR